MHPGISYPGDRPRREDLPAIARVAAVEGPPRIRLTVHLDVASEPLSGTVGVEDEEERRFQGWIELANAIDRAHAARPADRSQTPDAAE